MIPVKEAAVKQGARIWTGRRHGQIIQRMFQEEGFKFVRVTKEHQGFIDVEGNFLTRAEAFIRAKACGQILVRTDRNPGLGEELVSEDLY